MERNDRVIPVFALLLSFALFFVAYLDGRYIEAAKGYAQEKLSAGQVGIVAFAIVLLLYAIIGFVTVWLEGTELRPSLVRARASRASFLAIIAVSVTAVAVSGIFVQAILYAKRTQTNNPAAEGILFGVIALLIAAVLALYKRHFLDEVVQTEPENSEVPW